MNNLYGARETAGLSDPDRYHRENTYRIQRTVAWTHPGLRITRLRLISDPGFPVWDISYCHGRIGDEPVSVDLPFTQLPKRGLSRAIVEHAKRDGLYAKRLGILGCISTLQ